MLLWVYKANSYSAATLQCLCSSSWPTSTLAPLQCCQRLCTRWWMLSTRLRAFAWLHSKQLVVSPHRPFPQQLLAFFPILFKAVSQSEESLGTDLTHSWWIIVRKFTSDLMCIFYPNHNSIPGIQWCGSHCHANRMPAHFSWNGLSIWTSKVTRQH